MDLGRRRLAGFVVGMVRWMTVIVVLLNAGYCLFRDGAARSTQIGRRGREAAREL